MRVAGIIVAQGSAGEPRALFLPLITGVVKGGVCWS